MRSTSLCRAGQRQALARIQIVLCDIGESAVDDLLGMQGEPIAGAPLEHFDCQRIGFFAHTPRLIIAAEILQRRNLPGGRLRVKSCHVDVR